MITLRGYDNWKTREPENWYIKGQPYLEFVVKTSNEKHIQTTCYCDAYWFPHRFGGGRCKVCDECGYPKANCHCSCPSCGYYPCQCEEYNI